MDYRVTSMNANLQSYDGDIVAWSNEQARLLREGQFSKLDIEHIADEIEDVGKSEQRELESRMAVLLAHLLKWQYQPERRGNSWEATIRTQRTSIDRRMKKTPSLKTSLSNPDWWADAWDDAVRSAVQETGISLAVFPLSCPWAFELIMDADFWPC